MAKSKAEVKALLAGAKRAERTVPIPMRGDLAAECEELERRLLDLETAESGPGASLSGSPEAREIAERIEALREQMTESVIQFRVRALPARRSKGGLPTWRQLKDAHPPREGHAADKENGVNTDDFSEELLRLSIVDPVLDEDDWANLLEVLSDGTYNVLIGNCFGVNQGDVDIPFSSAALRILRNFVPE